MGSIITGTQAGTGAGTGLNEALKIVFDEPMNNNIIQDSEVYDLFERDENIPIKDTPGGRYIELAHYAADGGGFGARRENEALPESSPPSVFNGRAFLRKNHMIVEMTGEAYRRAVRGEGSWLTWARDALPNALRRFTHHADRQAIGYGQGVLARVASIDAGRGFFTVDRTFGITGYGKAAYQFLRNDFIRFGSDVHGTTLRVGRYRVTRVNNRTGRIDVDPALDAGVVVGDFIAIGDSAGNNFTGGVAQQPKEMMGLLGCIDDGAVRATFQNVVRADWPEYQAVLVDAATESTPAGAFNEEFLLFADDQCFELGMGRPDFIVGSRAQERQYIRFLRSQRRLLDPRSYQNDGGKERGFVINLNGRAVRFRAARKMMNEVAFGIERGTLKKWRNGTGFFWDDTTGSIMERVVTSAGRFDAYYAVGVLEEEIGCLMPARNWVARGINVAVNPT